MKKIFTALTLAFGSLSGFAQQDPQFSQYMYNNLFMNPAYAGMKGSLCATAIGRQQWSGFDGAPRSLVFSLETALPKRFGGIGFNILTDQLGFENNTQYKLSYSFHVQNVFGGTIGIGAELGAFSKRIGPRGNQQWNATTNWTADQVIVPQTKKTVPDMGFGLWYQHTKGWFGISSTHLNAQVIDGGQQTIANVNHDLKYQMARHYFITGGLNLFTSGPWEFRPSFLVKTDATITTFDVNMTAVYRQRFWLGASYRYQDAICPMIGFQLGMAKIGFDYDYTTSNLRNYNNGTFELVVNYCIPVTWPNGGGGDVRIFN